MDPSLFHQRLQQHRRHALEDQVGDAVRELAPGGVDVVFDPVGDAFTEPCVRNLAEGGRYLIANPTGPVTPGEAPPFR